MQWSARLARWAGLHKRRCVLCQTPCAPASSDPSVGTSPHLCACCRPALSLRRGGYCPSCGAMTALPEEPPRRCESCRQHPPPWERLGFFAAHEGTLREAIANYKYRQSLGLTRLLAGLLLCAAEEHGLLAADTEAAPVSAPPLVIPVPLHPRRLRQRGFNQALELCRPLARALGAELAPTLLTRVRNTRPQIGLGRAERQANVARAFRVDPAQAALLTSRRVLLVDDVYTTGSTLAEAARCLLATGAAGVDVLVLARRV